MLKVFLDTKNFLDFNTLRKFFYISILTIKYSKVNKKYQKKLFQKLKLNFKIQKNSPVKNLRKISNTNSFKECYIFLEY